MAPKSLLKQAEPTVRQLEELIGPISVVHPAFLDDLYRRLSAVRADYMAKQKETQPIKELSEKHGQLVTTAIQRLMEARMNAVQIGDLGPYFRRSIELFTKAHEPIDEDDGDEDVTAPNANRRNRVKATNQQKAERIGSLHPFGVINWAAAFAPSVWQGWPNPVFDRVLQYVEEYKDGTIWPVEVYDELTRSDQSALLLRNAEEAKILKMRKEKAVAKQDPFEGAPGSSPSIRYKVYKIPFSLVAEYMNNTKISDRLFDVKVPLNPEEQMVMIKMEIEVHICVFIYMMRVHQIRSI